MKWLGLSAWKKEMRGPGAVGKAVCLERKGGALVQWVKTVCLERKGGGPGAVVKAICLQRRGALVQWVKLSAWKGRAGAWCSG